MSASAILTWKIENFSCLKDACLQSPIFESHHSSMWELSVWPVAGDEYVDLKLKKVDDMYLYTMNCAIAFLDSEGSPLLWSEETNCFMSDSSRPKKREVYFRFPIQHFKEKINRIRNKKVGVIKDIKKDEVCSSIKSKFVVNDILTVECHLWFQMNPHLELKKCFARTRFEPNPIKKKKTFTLNVRAVSSLTSNFFLRRIEPIGTESLENFLTVELKLDEEGKFFVNVTPSLYRIQANFKISLLDVSWKKIQFASVDCYFDEKQKKKGFNTNITKLMLMGYRNKFLSNEMLSLVFDCTLSYEIGFNRLISESEYIAQNTQPIVSTRSDSEINRKTVKPEVASTNNPGPPINVNQALKYIYEEGILSDFCLRVQDRTFPVHKAILGARSSVFLAMFTADMKEKESGSVDIPDVDADTIQRMLKFVYCDSVQEDMQWESASSLYAIAGKYALDPLKQKCSDILMSGLNESNVFDVLMIADTYHDRDLKAAALDFILENDKEIVGTELWSRFAEKHIQLAFEAIQKMYIKKMDMQ